MRRRSGKRCPRSERVVGHSESGRRSATLPGPVGGSVELLWCPPLQLIEEIQQKRRVQIRFLRSRGSFHRAEDTTKRLQMRSLYRGGNLTVRRFGEELVVCPRK
jgi:hypothetical protein